MTSVIAAIIGAIGVVLAAGVGAWVGGLARRMRADLDACLRDRRQLRQLVQLVAGAFVGLLPEADRLTLLRSIDETVGEQEDRAA